MKTVDMKAVDVRGWITETGSLEQLNTKLESPLEIVLNSKYSEGTSYDARCAGLSKEGKVVAIEYESSELPTYCLVDPRPFGRK